MNVLTKEGTRKAIERFDKLYCDCGRRRIPICETDHQPISGGIPVGMRRATANDSPVQKWQISLYTPEGEILYGGAEDLGSMRHLKFLSIQQLTSFHVYSLQQRFGPVDIPSQLREKNHV